MRRVVEIAESRKLHGLTADKRIEEEITPSTQARWQLLKMLLDNNVSEEMEDVDEDRVWLNR